MRVLHVLPRSAELCRRAAALVAALEARGHAGATWPGEGAADGDAEQLLRLACELRRGPEVDLVHNHRGPLTLALAGALELPLLSTLYAAPSAAERAFLAGCAPPPALAAEGFAPDPALGCEAELAAESAAGERAAVYAALYESLVERWRARRADGSHDERPWGAYWVLDDQPAFKVKRIAVRPGARLSYQRHRERSEIWFVVAGQAKVTLDGRERTVGPGEDVRIEPGQAHRIENTGSGDVVFVEVQRGSYFGEDDIERLDDDYGRC